MLGNKLQSSGKLSCFIDPNYMEEELYIRGNVVIWSEGLVYSDDSNSRKTICAFSSNYPIKHALWCKFLSEKPLLSNTENNSKTDKLECVCIIDSQNIRAFTRTNEDFISTLPFQVSQVWSTKYGILIEKQFHGIPQNAF